MFDVPMGSYDGAEVCELVGLYILHKISVSKLFAKNGFGIYRDDGLGITSMSGRSGEHILRQSLIHLFKNEELDITCEVGAKVTDFLDIDSEIADKLSLENLEGVIAVNVQKSGAASKAGLKEGDVIRTINSQSIQNKATIEEYLANLYPGDVVTVSGSREDKSISKNVTLLNREGGIGIIKKEVYYSDFLGAEFEVVSKVEKDLLRIENGVKVIDVDTRGFIARLDIPKGWMDYSNPF